MKCDVTTAGACTAPTYDIDAAAGRRDRGSSSTGGGGGCNSRAVLLLCCACDGGGGHGGSGGGDSGDGGDDGGASDGYGDGPFVVATSSSACLREPGRVTSPIVRATMPHIRDVP